MPPPLKGGLRRSGTFTPRLKACASDRADFELAVFLPAAHELFAATAIRCLQSSYMASAVKAVF